MTHYQTEFVPNVEPLPSQINQKELNAKGLYVVQGLTRGLAIQLSDRSQEPAILDFTPNDYIRPDNDKPGRFFDVNAAIRWIAKCRLVIPLVTADETLMGIGWMGPEKPSDGEPEIPGALTTFAIRIYEGATGRRNCLPYINAILEAHDEAYGNDGVWLESWGDNSRALSSYGHAGFIEVARIMSERRGQPKERVYMTLGELSVK